MPENTLIISQYKNNGITYLAFDNGYSGSEVTNGIIYQITGDVIERIDIKNTNASKDDLKKSYHKMPFLFFCAEMNDPIVVDTVEEFERVVKNNSINKIMYFGICGGMYEALIDASEFQNKEIYTLKVPKIKKEFIVLTNTDAIEEIDEELIVENGIEYKKEIIPDELISENEEIGIQINSGKTFDVEKTRLNKTVDSMKQKINEIESKEGFTKRYSVVHGGDDGTESIQLQSAKAKSARDYDTINKLFGLAKKPYRYRVDIKDEEGLKTYYFGPVHCNEIDLEYEILSEYSPLGEKLVTYNSNNHKINNAIQLRRQFDINNSVLKSYTNIIGTVQSGSEEFRDGLTDPFLISVFRMRRAEHEIKDIILTIQENQNAIVNADENDNIIVQGCAGSGKTMVMMHRLSRLQNWVKAFDPKEVLIITPNDQYKMYMKAVTEGLAISNITQTTIEKYYNDLLSEFHREFIYKGKIVSENKVNAALLGFIYSKEFILKVDAAYNNVIKEREQLIIDLLDGYKLLAMKNPSKRNVINDDYPAYCRQLLEPLIQEIYTPEVELQKKEDTLVYLNKRIDDLKINGKKNLQDEYYDVVQDAWESARAKLLKNLPNSDKKETIERILKIDLTSASDKEILLFLFKAQRILPSIEDEIQKCEEAESKFLNVDKEINEIKIRRDRVSSEIVSLKQLVFSPTIKAEIQSLEQRVKAVSHIGTYRKIFEITIKEVLLDNNIKLPRGVHKYDLYARLLFCRKYFGRKPEIHKFICVDEGQDISLCEYDLLYEMSGKRAKFNIYGDVNQTLHPEKGITKWSDLQQIWGTQKTYSLNENYRNTNEITEFCNNEFNMSMKRIGISGPFVRNISKKELIAEIDTSGNLKGERWAILIPRTLNKEKIKKVFTENKITTDKLGKNRISLMYVDEIKGFEFEKVYVLPEKMDKNTKYVAYTRALNELIIVDV